MLWFPVYYAFGVVITVLVIFMTIFHDQVRPERAYSGAIMGLFLLHSGDSYHNITDLPADSHMADARDELDEEVSRLSSRHMFHTN